LKKLRGIFLINSDKTRSYGDTCPIAAQASQGALALIRTSGNGSLELLADVFSRKERLLDAPGNSIVHGWISGDAPVDDVLVSVYRAPRSYTGEDGADISCHGGSAAVNAVLEILRKAGFEDALPGEFTFRAFMNGKIDLTQSESVMELVSAKTKTGLEHAVKRLSGELETEIKAVRDTLLETVSVIELYLDYSEDEIEEPEPDQYQAIAEEALKKLRLLSASYQREKMYQEGALVVIAGRPNAGKSSLFNALLKEDRSIVTEIPGTTRDWIESGMVLEGIPLRLVDTAGLRNTLLDNTVEIQGIERSKNLTQEADIVLYTVDGSEGLNSDDESFLVSHTGSLLLVWNKADLKKTPEEIRKNFSPLQKNRPLLVEISALTRQGMDVLSAAITNMIINRNSPVLERFSVGLGTQRQKDLCEKAISFLEEALDSAKQEETLDVIAPLLRESLNALGEITGEVSSTDVLEVMFNRFCLGK
jgi:tRNA modification GTPase